MVTVKSVCIAVVPVVKTLDWVGGIVLSSMIILSQGIVLIPSTSAPTTAASASGSSGIVGVIFRWLILYLRLFLLQWYLLGRIV